MIETPRHEEQVRLPLDRRGFLRRECASCHRQFKLRWSETDAALVQRRLGSVVAHGNSHELSSAAAWRTCPYCGDRAEADAWWTEEQRLYLSKMGTALDEEIRFEQLRHVERTLRHNPYLTFLPIAPARARFAIRPEPDDMRVVPLVCCSDDVKIRDSWAASIHCPFCGVEHAMGGAAPGGPPAG